MRSSDLRLGLVERIAVDLFALALMVHSVLVAFAGELRLQDALSVSVAVGLMQRGAGRR